MDEVTIGILACKVRADVNKKHGPKAQLSSLAARLEGLTWPTQKKTESLTKTKQFEKLKKYFIKVFAVKLTQIFRMAEDLFALDVHIFTAISNWHS